ncbi:hypothetical protein [Hyphomicrobium sp. 99]|uniref:hypothetical protein n=1 Tax=Hyphomicrobium sp. 99 TaxID=1163419 RepID=UPI0005F86ED9|nr:hypothetical protein [Hyphomicrobium sp. 99]
MLLSIREGMPKEIPQVFARRARLSSKAIITAVALTLAALAAIAVASHRETKTSVKTISPVTQVTVESESLLVPVVAREARH